MIEAKEYKAITFGVVTFRKVTDGVGFYLNDSRWWTERKRP